MVNELICALLITFCSPPTIAFESIDVGDIECQVSINAADFKPILHVVKRGEAFHPAWGVNLAAFDFYIPDFDPRNNWYFIRCNAEGYVEWRGLLRDKPPHNGIGRALMYEEYNRTKGE